MSINRSWGDLFFWKFIRYFVEVNLILLGVRWVSIPVLFILPDCLRTFVSVLETTFFPVFRTKTRLLKAFTSVPIDAMELLVIYLCKFNSTIFSMHCQEKIASRTLFVFFNIKLIIESKLYSKITTVTFYHYLIWKHSHKIIYGHSDCGKAS